MPRPASVSGIRQLQPPRALHRVVTHRSRVIERLEPALVRIAPRTPTGHAVRRRVMTSDEIIRQLEASRRSQSAPNLPTLRQRIRRVGSA